MSRANYLKYSYYFLLLSISIVFFIQNTLVPFFSDDLWMLNTLVKSSINAYLESIKDFLVNFWYTQNGRILPHALMVVSVNAGHLFYDITVSLIFLFSIYTITKLTVKDCNWTKSIFTSSIVLLLYFYLAPNASSNFYWAAGGCNYLFPIFLTSAYLLLLRNKTNVNGIKLVLFAFFSLCAGWSHEIFSLPISFALLCYILWSIYSRKINKVTRTQLVLIFMFWLGALMIVVSPGTLNRIGGTMGSENSSFVHAFLAKFVTSFKIFRYGRFFYIVLLYILFLIITSKEKLKTFIESNSFYLLALIGSIGIVMILGVGGRAILGAEFFSLLIILNWINDRCRDSKLLSIGWLFSLLVIVHQCVLIKPMQDSWNTYVDVVAQTKEPNFEGTARMIDWHSTNPLIDPFVAHPYDMMMQDMWMRMPLHCNVCNSTVYDQLEKCDISFDISVAKNINGDFIFPYSNNVIDKIAESDITIELDPISNIMPEGLFFATWHRLISKIWPDRYPSIIHTINSEEYSILCIKGQKIIRFERPIRPIARNINSVTIN